MERNGAGGDGRAGEQCDFCDRAVGPGGALAQFAARAVRHGRAPELVPGYLQYDPAAAARRLEAPARRARAVRRLQRAGAVRIPADHDRDVGDFAREVDVELERGGYAEDL